MIYGVFLQKVENGALRSAGICDCKTAFEPIIYGEMLTFAICDFVKFDSHAAWEADFR